jgi:lipid II:glycine glycyltransferase (peptidoglycan interpeptide bridge formation enzyme)
MASVKFISHVEQNENGGWYIKLTDTFEDTNVECANLDEYKEKLEEMGSLYGNDIEVQWTRSKNLSPKNMEELQDKMAKLQEEYQKDIDEINNKENEQVSNTGGFNPNE